MRILLSAAIAAVSISFGVIAGGSTIASTDLSALGNLAPIVDVAHVPPVSGPVIDPFRLPEFDWQPGNRGLEYDTWPGQTVRASSDGVVTFSGQVGGRQFVTISHSPDLRTTVGFVTETLVSAGTSVRQGDAIAIAGETMHFTARHHGRYIDPQLLFQRYRTVVRLVGAPGE